MTKAKKWIVWLLLLLGVGLCSNAAGYERARAARAARQPNGGQVIKQLVA